MGWDGCGYDDGWGPALQLVSKGSEHEVMMDKERGRRSDWGAGLISLLEELCRCFCGGIGIGREIVCFLSSCAL